MFTANDARELAKQQQKDGFNSRLNEVLKKIKRAAYNAELRIKFDDLPWLKLTDEDIQWLENKGYFVTRYAGYYEISWDDF